MQTEFVFVLCIVSRSAPGRGTDRNIMNAMQRDSIILSATFGNIAGAAFRWRNKKMMTVTKSLRALGEAMGRGFLLERNSHCSIG